MLDVVARDGGGKRQTIEIAVRMALTSRGAHGRSFRVPQALMRPMVPLPMPKPGPVDSVLRRASFAAIIPGDTAVEQVFTMGVFSFLNIYNTLLIGRLILTWFPNPPQAIVSPLSTLCDPYLNLFRGLIPPLGGTLDLSPILAFFTLNLFTNAAAALPSDMPGTTARSMELRRQHRMMNPRSTDLPFMKRFAAEQERRKQRLAGQGSSQ